MILCPCLSIPLLDLGKEQRGSGRDFLLCNVFWKCCAETDFCCSIAFVLLDFLLPKGEDVGRMNLVPLLPQESRISDMISLYSELKIGVLILSSVSRF